MDLPSQQSVLSRTENKAGTERVKSFYPLNHKGSLGSKKCVANCEYGQDDDILNNNQK